MFLNQYLNLYATLYFIIQVQQAVNIFALGIIPEGRRGEL